MVTHMRSTDVGRYRYNYDGFYEKSIHQMSINRERMLTTKGVYTSLMKILSFLLFLS